MINGAWDALELAFIAFFWVETKGKTLEEIDELFDGQKHSNAPDLAVIRQEKTDMGDVLEAIDCTKIDPKSPGIETSAVTK